MALGTVSDNRSSGSATIADAVGAYWWPDLVHGVHDCEPASDTASLGINEKSNRQILRHVLEVEKLCNRESYAIVVKQAFQNDNPPLQKLIILGCQDAHA